MYVCMLLMNFFPVREYSAIEVGVSVWPGDVVVSSSEINVSVIT